MTVEVTVSSNYYSELDWVTDLEVALNGWEEVLNKLWDRDEKISELEDTISDMQDNIDKLDDEVEALKDN